MQDPRLARADFVTGVCLVALGMGVLVGSYRMPRLEEMGINPLSVPGIVPGAIGAVLALLIVIMRGRFEWSTFYSALLETGRTSAMILFIVVGATAFTGVFNITGGLRASQDLIRGLADDPYTLVAVMLLVVFILGMFLDWTGIVLLSFPIFLPLVAEMGIDPLWFVVLMAVVLQTSFLSPPFGYALFYMRAISPPEVTTTDIIRGVIPFIALIIVMCAMIIVFPALVTWLPTALYGG